MGALMKNPGVFAYGLLVLAAAVNLIAIWCLKKSAGFTQIGPTLGVIVAMGIVQWLQSRAMASGIDVGQAVTLVIVMVMIGSVMVGTFLFGETTSPQKLFGFGLAITGVAIASLAKT